MKLTQDTLNQLNTNQKRPNQHNIDNKDVKPRTNSPINSEDLLLVTLDNVLIQIPSSDDLIGMKNLPTGNKDDQQLRLSNMITVVKSYPLSTIESQMHIKPWQQLFTLIRNGVQHGASIDVIPEQDTLRQLLLKVHSKKYINELIKQCIAAKKTTHPLKKGSDIVITNQLFELLIKDLMTSINSSCDVLISIGLPSHHAYTDLAQGFCVLNKTAMLLLHHATKQQAVRHVIIGTDINRDDGLSNVLRTKAADLPIYHIDLFDSRVYPRHDLNHINQEFSSDGKQQGHSTYWHNNNYHYFAVDLKSCKRKGAQLHPALDFALNHLYKNLHQAIEKKEKIALFIPLGWDSHLDETASCGTWIGNRILTAEEKKIHRFSDDDLLYFYKEILILYIEHKESFTQIYWGLEGGYNTHMYESQLNLFLTCISSYLAPTSQNTDTNAIAVMARGFVHFTTQKYHDVIFDLNEIIKIMPQSSAYFLRAKSHSLLNHYYEAVRDYSKVIELDNEYVHEACSELETMLLGLEPTHINHRHAAVFKFLYKNNAILNASDLGELPHVDFGNQSANEILGSLNANGHTLAHVAVINNDVTVLKFLYHLKVPLDKKNQYGVTPAYIAAELGHVSILKLLHDFKVSLDTTDNNGATAVHAAAKNGHVDVLLLLHDLKVPLDTTDNNGTTAVHIAALNGHVSVLQLLHDFNTPLDTTAKNGCTAVHIAARNGHIPVLQLLHDFNVPLDTAMNDETTAVHIAAQNGHVSALELLHKPKAPLDTANTNEATAVFIAAYNGDVAVLELLHKLKAPLDTANTNGATAVHYAALNGHISALELLHKLNAPLDTANKNGATAVHYAAQNGHVSVLEFLHKLNVPLDKADKNGVTAVHIAAKNGHVSVLEFLHKLNIPLDKAINNGVTAVHIAAQNEHVSVLEFLNKLKAPLDTADKNGATAAYDIAQAQSLSQQGLFTVPHASFCDTIPLLSKTQTPR